MLVKDPVLIRGPLNRTYIFSRWRGSGGLFGEGSLAFIHDRAFAKENLRLLAQDNKDDPFNDRLLEVWQLVFEKPWTRPRSIHELIEDLSCKIHRGELFVYQEHSAPEKISAVSKSEAASGPIIGVLPSNPPIDKPRTQGPPVISDNNKDPRDAPLQSDAPEPQPSPIESTLDRSHLYHTVGLDTVTAQGAGGDTIAAMYDKVYDSDGNQRPGIDNDTANAFNDAYLQAQDISDMRAEGYRMAAQDAGLGMLLGPGARLASVGGNRLARPLINKLSDFQFLKRFKPYTSGEELLKGRKDWAELSGKLREAANGKGNFGIGSGTREQADAMGLAWVGEGHKVASDGKTLISANGLRQYRPPSFKPRLDTVQANFEQRYLGQQTQRWQSNAHLDITD